MKSLRVVLVASKYPRNVGMASRILSNYGVDRLILVSPQCEIDEEARQGAAQGQQPLRQATIYSNWQDFYGSEPEGLRIAFSRRQGKRRVSQPLQELLHDEVVRPEQITYLIFGAEDHGLSAEDLEMVHRMAYFDLPGSLQSMNLSHSVLLALQIFYNRWGSVSSVTPSTEVTKDPEPTLRLWLETLNFDLDSQNRWNMLTRLKQMLMRSKPTANELHHLEMVIQQTVRKLKEE